MHVPCLIAPDFSIRVYSLLYTYAVISLLEYVLRITYVISNRETGNSPGK